MCLLKPGHLNSLCGHNECKNFYFLNRQACVYTLPQNKMIETPMQVSKDIPMNCILSQINASNAVKKVENDFQLGSLNEKRSMIQKSDFSTDEETENLPSKKKMKTDVLASNAENANLALNSLKYMNNNMNSYNPSLNSLLLQNIPKTVNNMMPNVSTDGLVNASPELISYLQKPQNLTNNVATPLYLQGQQFNVNALMTNNLSPSNPMNIENNNIYLNMNESKPANKFKEMMDEFENNIFGFMQSQNKLITDLKDKNDLLQDTLACLIGEISSLKNIIVDQNGEKQEKSQKLMNVKTNGVSNSNESLNTDDLLDYLTGGKTDFKYEIALTNELSLPLYRERNFDLSVRLMDQDGQPVINSNKISLSVNLYTCQNPTTLVDVNTAGNKIFKGFTDKDFIRGFANFDKIQVKEVTSHFRNGWVYMVVQPKPLNGSNPSLFLEKEGVTIDIQDIKPLIIGNVVVKAKKIKEKDDRN